LLANSAVRNPARDRLPARLSSVLPTWLWIVAPAVVAQVAVLHVFGRSDTFERALPVLLILSHLLLLPFLLRNLSFIGFQLVLVGLLLNLTVMLCNGGLMPVAPEAVRAVGRQDPATLSLGEHIAGTKNVYLLAQDARLWELSDVIILRLPHPFTKAVSAGDLLVALGIAFAITETALRASAAGRRS